MPELPDVEAFRTVLEQCARGRRIQKVDVYDTGVLHGVNARQLRRELEGRTFAGPERHGKWLLGRTDGPTVMFHFGMTGELVCCGTDAELHQHDRVVLTVAEHRDRQLRYRDQRKLKGLWLVDDAGADRLLEEQGPDAATVSRKGFEKALAGRRGGVKPALTDQSVVAGLGNLLADEILWRARLDPAARVSTLGEADRDRLYTEMNRTLRSAVRAGEVPPRRTWLTGHRDETSPACPRCGTRLRHSRVGGRGTVWCPHCQRA